MKRAVLIVAVAALCVAGSAVAQDRNGGMIGSGTRAEDGGVIGSGTAVGGLIGSGTRTESSDQIYGSGSAVGQIIGSGSFTMTTQDQFMGSGGRTADDSQVLGSGWLIGSGTRTEDSGYLIGGNSGGYFGSGLSVLELRLSDGWRLLVVSSDEGMFVIELQE